MLSYVPHRLHVLCIFLVISLLSAQPSITQKDYYIDPTNIQSTQKGDITNPFKTLSAAFNDAQSFVSASSPTSPLSITFYCKEDSVFSFEENAMSFTLDGTGRYPSTILITAYGTRNNLPVMSQSPRLHVSSASFHLSLSIPKVKLTIENFNFEFQIEGSASTPEFILIEGKDSEVTFNHCAFQTSKVNLTGPDNALIRLKTGRYLFKKCQFSQLELTNPLIVHDESEGSLVKYELNEFQDIIVNASSLIKAVNVSSFDFVGSKVEKTSGRLLEVTKLSTAIVSENNFTDVVGQFPLYFNSAQKIIFGKNKISFGTSEHASHEGFLSVANFNILGISDTTISEYFGLSSAISVAIESAYSTSHTPMIMLQGLKFLKNSLCVHDDQANKGLALVNVNLKQKALISVDNTIFSGNTLYDMREHPVGRSEGASTFWIDAIDSSLKIKKSTLENNKADRALSNLYVSVGDLNVVSSTFKSNVLLEGSEASANSNTDVIFSNFGWFGQDLIFNEDTFQANYNDYGGAISIREAEGLRIPHSVSIENCVFVKNKAKEGGAIYTNVVSDVLESIQLENNRFEGNMADIDSDYSESSKIMTEAKPKLYMQVIAQSQKKDYRSGEFTLQNAASGEDTGYTMEFYIANHKGERTSSDKKYYSTIYITSSLEGEAYLVNNFTNKLTGPSVGLSSFAVVAPLGSLNVIKLTMQNKDDSTESYSFEFKVGVGLVSGGSDDCEKGEIFLEKEQTCVKCPPGTYSLTENALFCQPCPLGGDCSQGGDKIKALPGFWRDIAENENFVVYNCVNPEKCIGDNQCAEGYAGPLCEACNTKDAGKGIYRPFLRNTCKSCNSKNPLEILGDVVGLLAPIAILLYTVYTLVTAKKGSTKQFSWCLYCNLFFSYMQNLFILGVLDYLPLPHIFNYIVNVIANPSFPVFGYLTCYFPELITSSDAYMGILSLFAAIPLTKILIIVLMMKLIARRGNVLKSSLLGLIWLAFLEAPGILDFCLRFFDCRQVGNWVYSPFFLDLECDTSNFELLSTFILLPVILLLIIVCPLAITYSLSRGSLRSDEVESQKNLRVMVLAKSGDHIIKSHRSWVFFYFASFGRLGLLLLSTSDTLSFLSFSAVGLYFAALALMNMARKIVPFKRWRSSLLFIDMLMLLASSILGYGLNYIDDGVVKTWLLTALWVGNAVYLFNVNVCDTKMGDIRAYGKLQEENISSSEEEQHKQNSEQLDETM